jgi:hypothetical protein
MRLVHSGSSATARRATMAGKTVAITLGHELQRRRKGIDFDLWCDLNSHFLRRLVDDVAHAVAPRRQHQRKLLQALERDRPRIAPAGMALQQEKLLVDQGMGGKPGLAARAVDDREVEVARCQPIDQGAAVGFIDPDLDVRKFFTEPPQHVGQHGIRDGGDDADRDLAENLAAQLHHRLVGVLEIQQHGQVEPVHRLARRGRNHAACGALEQVYAEALLQPADLHAQGRLHDIEPACRSRHAALFVEAYEILNLSQVEHGSAAPTAASDAASSYNAK